MDGLEDLEISEWGFISADFLSVKQTFDVITVLLPGSACDRQVELTFMDGLEDLEISEWGFISADFLSMKQTSGVITVLSSGSAFFSFGITV